VIGDRVWADLDGDGIQDAGEPGLAGVTVALLGVDVLGGSVSLTTVTDGDGLYRFEDLVPGTYTVTVTNPGGYVFSPQGQGDDAARDSDVAPAGGVTAALTLVSGQSNLTIDAGLVPLARVGDYIWHDLNANGIQDDDEPGVAGVTVMLIVDGGNGTSMTTLTDSDGFYSFDALIPGIEYQIVFELPSGYANFTVPHSGSDGAVDSDADPLSGATPALVLAPGQFQDALDAGLLRSAVIGDRVWADLDGDGIQDAGEPGLAGVTMTLLGVDVLGGSVSLTTVTDGDGLYRFEDLVPGTYTVTVTNPGGYVFSPQGQGDDAARDSDVDGFGMAGPVALGSAGRNFTIDAGLTPIIVLAPDKNPGTPQEVMVVNAGTGAVLQRFLAYEVDYGGGTRVAVADLDGDGVEEIIAAPGRNRAPEIRVFSLDGKPVPGFPEFLAYARDFMGGVHVAVADVDGDGRPDIVTVPSYGAADVRVFLNRYKPDKPWEPAFQATPDISFQAFSAASIGGAVVAVADMGKWDNGSFGNERDGKAEIVIGTGGGTTATVSVFTVSATTVVCVQTFRPFTGLTSDFLGGVFLDVAPIEEAAIPAIIVGTGANGTSRVEVWTWDTSNMNLFLRGAISQAFTGSSSNAPVHVAAAASSNGVAYAIFAVQGPIGTTREVQRFDITSTAPTLQFQQAAPLTGFSGPWFIATRKMAISERFGNSISPVAIAWTNPVIPHDVNDDGLITPLDALETINYLNKNRGQTTPPAQQFSPQRFFDTNADGAITPADVLVILNHINRTLAAAGEAEAGGLAEEFVSVSRALPLDLDGNKPRQASSGVDHERDQTFGVSARSISPDGKWQLPGRDDEVEPALRFSKRWLDDPGWFDLESVLEEIATGTAVSRLARAG